MNPFAKPEEAMPYDYTEFPKLEVENASNLIPADAVGSFIDFETALNAPAEETQTVVQTAIFQDFKQVIQAAASQA